MKVYNQNKTEILTEYDLDLGHLENDTILVPEVQAVEEQSHIEILAEYPNGGKETRRVIDVEAVEYQPAHEEQILVYIPYTQAELDEIELNQLRERRELECFPIINRGQLWYNTLTTEQLQELDTWYHAWLDVTITKQIPQKPEWL